MAATTGNRPEAISRRRAAPAAAWIAVLFMFVAAPAAQAVEEHKIKELVERARLTLELFSDDEDLQQYRAYVPYAHALLIVPSYMKGALGIGIAGGMGTLIMRDPATGQWSSPAFYSLRSASLGLQLGGSSSEMVLIFQTEKGVEVLNKTTIKLGMDAAVAAGNRGYGVEGATQTNFSADIAAFSRVKGAFMGASLSGTSLVVKNDWNTVYYGRNVSPMEILGGQVRNPHADPLSQAAARFFAENAGN